MEKNTYYYKELFANLQQNRNNGSAPHKAVLLLSIITLYGIGVYTDNRIYLNSQLEEEFVKLWNRLVTSEFHNCKLATPFYHMGGEPFWKLVPKEGCEERIKNPGDMYTLSHLKESIYWATIDQELANIMIDSPKRTIMANFILEKYFPETKDYYPYTYNYNA